MRRVPRLAALALLLGTLPRAPLVWAEDAAPESPVASAADEATASLAALDAPLFREREEAVEALIAGLPGTRSGVLAAFTGAEGRRRGLLARILAADGTTQSLDALLKALPSTSDPATTSAIRASLVAHAEEVAGAVASWRDADGTLPPPVAELALLLRRARVEALFLGRKSRTGTTGSYPGQFEVLRAERELALDVCLGILLDRPAKLPGQFPYGTYHWLRPPSFIVEKIELQYMALHAIGELATAEDTEILDELENFHHELEDVILKIERQARWPASAERGLRHTLLTTLARLRPEPWLAEAELMIEALRQNLSTRDDAAAMCMRLGRYAQAVRLYQLLQRSGESALTSYNLACTFARWSEETPDPRDAAARRSHALTALERAHKDGYPDWLWMEQDRDLDAVRSDPRFAELVRRMKADFRGVAPPPPPLPAPAMGEGATDGYGGSTEGVKDGPAMGGR
jgi:hypothetical protein